MGPCLFVAPRLTKPAPPGGISIVAVNTRRNAATDLVADPIGQCLRADSRLLQFLRSAAHSNADQQVWKHLTRRDDRESNPLQFENRFSDHLLMMFGMFSNRLRSSDDYDRVRIVRWAPPQTSFV